MLLCDVLGNRLCITYGNKSSIQTCAVHVFLYFMRVVIFVPFRAKRDRYGEPEHLAVIIVVVTDFIICSVFSRSPSLGLEVPFHLELFTCITQYLQYLSTTSRGWNWGGGGVVNLKCCVFIHNYLYLYCLF